jgi:hypothetical protein
MVAVLPTPILCGGIDAAVPCLPRSPSYRTSPYCVRGSFPQFDDAHRCEPLANPCSCARPLDANARRADETSRSKRCDPVCRPIRLLLCIEPAQPTSGSPSKNVVLRVFEATRHLYLGPIPCRQASRFRPTFQVLFCRGPMLSRHAAPLARSARATPRKSGRGGDGTRPAAANSAVTGSACARPSSTTSAPPRASNSGALSAIRR